MDSCAWSELTGEDVTAEENERHKVLMIDGNHMAYKNLFSDIHFNPEDNGVFFLWRHLMITDIFEKVNRFSPTRMILVFDEKGSWRYDIYSQYKEHRKAFRDASVVDFNAFFNVLNEFKEDIKTLFKNWYILNIPKCEGDDIIAILTKDVFAKSNSEVVIVSSDKDLNQLLDNKNVKQYDSIKKSYLESINPRQQLDLKILTGDKSDGIPSIKPRMGIKTAEKVLNEGLDDFLNSPENVEFKKNYERNKILIDFNFIPVNIKETIINTYQKYELKELDVSKLMWFFTKNRLPQMMKKWPEYSAKMKALR